MPSAKTVENGKRRRATGTLLAAYRLGLYSQLEYAVTYYNQYFGSSETQYGRNIRDAIHHVVDALVTLAGAGAEPQAARAMRRRLDRLRQRVEVSRLVQLRAERGPPAAVLALCRKIADDAARFVAGREHIGPWFRLGWAVGDCYVQLLPAQDRASLHLRALTTAAAAIPKHRSKRVPAVRSLAASAGKRKRSPLKVLRAASGRAKSPLDDLKSYQRTAWGHALTRLDLEIQRALVREPDPTVLHFTQVGNQHVVVRRGDGFALSPSQAAFLMGVYELGGERISRTRLKERFPVLKSANINRDLRDLPPALRQHIGSADGRYGGHFWADPPPPSDR